ncbi:MULTISPECIES: hypothetical protein [Cyanophyceae]|uniref:hypothetical protein n=1 Tax=Cyanophyceae TaxID=3028117 RepID=UPI0016878EEE|nr:hypothetical protein [Trichocoleus sp. FACHB-40]MBD2005435.1 hypothetical protein [Trichocoleus sp. FACHB-40]
MLVSIGGTGCYRQQETRKRSPSLSSNAGYFSTSTGCLNGIMNCWGASNIQTPDSDAI